MTGPIAAYCPMVISKKKHGMPINNNIRAYGIRKAPPPCLKHKYGNLQTLPKPETKKITVNRQSQRVTFGVKRTSQAALFKLYGIEVLISV